VICHRTLGHTEAAARVVGFKGPLMADGKTCIGSRCAMWVPEHGSTSLDSSGPVIPGGGSQFSASPVRFERGCPTGRGWCADNLRREPWGDPAAKEPT
jgi:hypothetical protein